MIGKYIRRGLAAGLLAGLLAGLFAFAAGEPVLEAAIALEDPAAPPDQGLQSGDGAVSRTEQRIGLVVAMPLLGLAVGAALGLVSAWAVGRVRGDAWTRALKIGTTVTAAVVVFPALRYAPNPPGVGDPATVGSRTALYLGTAVIGVLLAAAAWTGARQLAQTRLSRPARQALVAGGVLVAGGLLIAGLPAVSDAGQGVPGDLLWQFRLSSIGTQTLLWLGSAVGIGLLSARAENEMSA